MKKSEETEIQLLDIPAIVTNNRTILPGVLAHIDIVDNESYEAFKNAMAEDKKILLAALEQDSADGRKTRNLYRHGTIALIKQAIKTGDNNYRIMIEGQQRAKIYGDYEAEDLVYLRLVIEAEPEELADEIWAVPVYQAKLEVIREKFDIFSKINGKIPNEYTAKIMKSSNLYRDIWKLVNILSISNEKRQELFELDNVDELLDEIAVLLSNEIEICAVANDFRKKVKGRVEKNQKDYVLREQMRLIREELGDEGEDEFANELRSQVDHLDAQDYVKEKLYKELKKLKRMSQQSSEANVIQNYVETIVSLPWNKVSQDNLDLKKAEEILNSAHYGLTKIKERIIEFLAVRIFTKGKTEQSNYRSPVLCLVGPPGTGKTSIARSVADAMNKQYIRICLGGVSDESEIRGHRRTYIGAKPGRIAEALINAGVSNPLIVFDEIDKLGKDYKGDPSSALLEVLDGEQNSRFVDRYLEMPVDLSEVFFMATANDISGIPKPLRDRMEIIPVSSYTSNEKEHIAKDYLVKKQRLENGLDKKQLNISNKALNSIITKYTREAGVRELERLIGKLCRKAAIGILEGSFEELRVTDKNLTELLGNPKFKDEKKKKKDMVGIVRGLAWTSVGGDTLEIEVNMMPGTGKLKLTGKLGDVMKESANIAYSYVRMIAPEHGIDKKTFTENDFHLHVPEGAVPKDGPSAGVTMATALFSAITGKKVNSDVAMTGEVTLRGNVLPIGGLKEKILAARLFGIKKVLVPEDNEPDVEEIEEEIKQGIDIVYVNSMKEVLEHTIVE